jgi:hypothetical protein
LIEQLELRAEDGTQLVLFALWKHPNDGYIEADAYIAQKAQPAGTIYGVQRGGKVMQLKSEGSIHEGFHAYPGDPKHFGRLAEPVLFEQLGVI